MSAAGIQLGLSAPALQPVMEIPLTPDSSGAVAFPTIEFDDASARVYLTAMRAAEDRFAWWRRNECEIGAAGAVVGAVLLFWIVMHVRRRPRRRGHVYCHRCNYDLTPATPVPESSATGLSMEAGFSTTVHMMNFGALPPAAEAVCPECGTKTAEHPAVRGKTTWERLALPLAVLVPLVVAGAWRCGHWLTFSGASSLARWPLEFVGKVIPGWPVARVPYTARQVQTVQAYRLTGPMPSAGVTLQYDAMYGASPTPDGRAWVWVEFGEANGWKNELCWHDFESGRTRRVNLGPAGDGFGGPQGFTPDGREALATMTGLITAGPTGASDGTTWIRLLGVDLETGALREIGKTRSLSTQTAPDSWQVPTVSGAARRSGDPLWAILTLDGPAGGRVTVGNAEGSREVQISAAGSVVNGTLSFDERDGLIAGTGAGAARSGVVIAADGTLTQRTGVPVRWGVSLGGAETSVLLDGVEKARLGVPGTGVSPVFSPDGRWIATVVTKAGPAPSGFTGSVLVWDLSKIPE